MGAIRNKNGIWINTEVFREAGLSFINTGKYCHEIPGTLEFDRFWDEETKRCLEGYEIGGARIPGRFYFYLNYAPIQKIDLTDGNRHKKKVDKKFLVPDFWDGDYNYYWTKYIAEEGLYPEDVGNVKKFIDGLHLEHKILNHEGGKGMIVGKARRRGFSYKNSADAAYDFTFLDKSLTLIAAYDKKYLFSSDMGIFTKVQNILNHLNQHAPAFKRTRLVNKLADGYIKSGYKEIQDDGTEIEKGKQSSIVCVSFMDNPDNARGVDAKRIIVEEAGTFANWKQTYYALEPGIKAGDYYTGTMSIFGTGGDMEGGTVDFADMFYNPEAYNLMAFENVWDVEEGRDVSGFFFPMYQNYEGAYDKQGNSDKEKAKELLTRVREDKKAKAKSPEDYLRHTTEYAWTPAEAFQEISNNIFPVDELKKQLGFCKTRPEYKGKLGTLSKDEFGNINFNINLDAQPLEYQGKTTDKSGWIQIWENPISRPPWGLYVAGLDPYATDEADYSESLGSMFIFKRYLIGEETKDIIVAEYTGRPSSFKEYYDNCILLLEYYGVVGNCLYENNINNFKTHLENRHKLYLLSKTPSILKSASNQNVNSYGLRVVGNSYSSVKNELITYINQWLREEDEEGISNVYKIKSIGLLQELIRYNNTGNFDRFISFALALVRHIELIKVPIKDTSYNSAQGKSFFSNKLFSN